MEVIRDYMMLFLYDAFYCVDARNIYTYHTVFLYYKNDLIKPFKFIITSFQSKLKNNSSHLQCYSLYLFSQCVLSLENLLENLTQIGYNAIL